MEYLCIDFYFTVLRAKLHVFRAGVNFVPFTVLGEGAGESGRGRRSVFAFARYQGSLMVVHFISYVSRGSFVQAGMGKRDGRYRCDHITRVDVTSPRGAREKEKERKDAARLNFSNRERRAGFPRKGKSDDRESAQIDR